MSATPSTLSFSGGELDPKFWGRTDLNKYGTALRLSHNGYPHLEGGWSNRQGTQYISTAKNGASYPCRVIPFTFSITQAYVIELGHLYARFYMNGGQIQTGTVTAWVTGTAYKPGGICSNGGVNYNCLVAHTSGTFATDLAAGDWYALSGTIVEVPTPYVSTDLALIKFEQSADTMYLTHPSYPPATITRTGNVNWSYAPIVFGSSVVSPTTLANSSGTGTASPVFSITTAGTGTSYLMGVTATVAGAESALSNSFNVPTGSVVAWTAVPSATTYTIYINQPYDRGYNSYEQLWVKYASVTSPYTFSSISTSGINASNPPFNTGTPAWVVTALDMQSHESLPSNTIFVDNTGTFTWAASPNAVSYNLYSQTNGIWGFVANLTSTTWGYPSPAIVPDTGHGIPVVSNPFAGTNNYPGNCAFYEGRLCYARTNNSPQQFWGSRSGDYNNFYTSSYLTDADAFNFVVLGGGQVNEIKRIMPMPLVPVLATGGGVWGMGQLGDPPISATNPPTIKPVDMRWGINDIRPIYLGNKALYFDNSSRRCRDIYYQVFAYNNQGNEVSIWARHLWKDYTAVNMAFNAYPDSILWIVRSDGNLIGLSYQREEGMTDFIAWHWHDTAGSFLDVCSINNPNGTQDVYFVVQRTINGTTTNYIERFVQRYFADIRNAWFVDAGVQYSTPIAITGITQANPCQITAPAHGLSNGATVRIANTVGMDQLSGQAITTNIDGSSTVAYAPVNRYYLVANVTTNTFTLTDLSGNAINSTAYNAYVSGGTAYKCSASFTGATQLANTPVVVLADGNLVPNITVSATGTFTIPNAAGIVTVGLPYLSEMMPMSPEYQNQAGQTVQDKLRTMKSVWLTVQNTNGLLVGWGPQDTLTMPAYTQAGCWGDPVMSKSTFESEAIELNPALDPRDATIYFQGTPGLPFTILRSIARMQEGSK